MADKVIQCTLENVNSVNNANEAYQRIISIIRCLTSGETADTNGLAINLTAATSDLALNSNGGVTLSSQNTLAKLMALHWDVPSGHYMVHRQLCGFMEGLLVFSA